MKRSGVLQKADGWIGLHQRSTNVCLLKYAGELDR